MATKLKQITYSAQEEEYWKAQPIDVDCTLTNSGAAVLGVSRVSVAFSRIVPAGVREDRAVTSLWVAKIVGGGLYSVVPVAELATLEIALDTFMSSTLSLIHSDWRCIEYAWHQVTEDSPRTDDPEHRGQKMGPATRVTVKNNPGTAGTTRLADQVSRTTTLRTCSRKHWGRSYWPGGVAGNMQTTFGRWTNTVVDNSVAFTDTLHNTWQDAGYQLGVYSMLHPAFLTPKAIECDDIPDIVRRRRAKQPSYRKIL